MILSAPYFADCIRFLYAKIQTMSSFDFLALPHSARPLQTISARAFDPSTRVRLLPPLTSSGYAKEMSEEYRKQHAKLIANHILRQNIVITTALIPGKTAPILVTQSMVDSMMPGSVVVDLAVVRGGNVEGVQLDHVIVRNGVSIVGYPNMAGRIPASASRLYAKNLLAFLNASTDTKTGNFNFDPEDEIVKATLLTHGGAVVHPAFVVD